MQSAINLLLGKLLCPFSIIVNLLHSQIYQNSLYRNIYLSIHLYITKTLILYVCMYVCMYVCSRNAAKTVHDSANFLGPPYSPFSCSVQYQVSFKSGKDLKNQFPIQSSTLREYLINANNLSGIIRWSYLLFFCLEIIFFINRCHNGNPTGSRVI